MVEIPNRCIGCPVKGRIEQYLGAVFDPNYAAHLAGDQRIKCDDPKGVQIHFANTLGQYLLGCASGIFCRAFERDRVDYSPKVA